MSNDGYRKGKGWRCSECGVYYPTSGEAWSCQDLHAAVRNTAAREYSEKYGALEAALEAAGIEPELLREWTREERLWMPPEPEDGKIIFSALGLGHALRTYRKFFVAGVGSPAWERCERMVSAGWMTRYGDPEPSGMQCFHVTQDGAELIGEKLPD